jgi:hypothetical protein
VPLTDRRVTDAVLACVRFGNRSLSDPKSVAALTAIRTSLATIFDTMARGISAHPDYARWRADPSNPGYMVTTIDRFELRLPWHLISDLPAEPILKEFLDFASRLKLHGDSAICLSGSLIARAAVGAVGDIDLCEYVTDTASTFADVARQALATQDADLVCLQVKAYLADGLDPLPESAGIGRPWLPAAQTTFLDQVKDAPIGKCDFVATSSAEGAVEITKMVLHVDGRYPDTEGGWDLSFPFQEGTVVTSGSWTPRRLTSPQALGRYIVWLYRQVSLHASTAPAKAAKRALAAGRLLYAPDVANAAIQVLKDDDLARRSAIEGRLDLHDRLGGIADEALDPFRLQVEVTVKALTRDFLGTTGQGVLGDVAASEIARIRDLLANRSDRGGHRLAALVASLTDLVEPAARAGRY